MSGHKFNKSIFRAYDIRGIVADTLSVQDAYYIGYNFAKKIFPITLFLIQITRVVFSRGGKFFQNSERIYTPANNSY